MRTEQPPREFWAEIIDMYKNMPFLWNKKHPHYTNQRKRSEGYNLLLEKYSEFDKNATLHVIKKKIDTMRTGYKREQKKVLASRDSDEYVPGLWYYDKLSFLDGHITSRPVKYCSEEDNDEKFSHSEYFEESNICDFLEESANENSYDEKPKKRIRLDHRDDNKSQTSEIFEEEKWVIIGKAIGIQIKDLDDHQSAIAQKLISDTLYYAKLGKLTEESNVSVNGKILPS
ncbi:hypothetical protein K1T71_007541 [Dendrolimus kikuchii]|uniref:Uncharacterized protein n=1 Tax=Dendrolimus kikuchii TaxID=765133 RepID=A0ACC1CZ04_9NEOP|nr:hypothetical protein K1T71_007541 [Dendrolimus kikuchii]